MLFLSGAKRRKIFLVSLCYTRTNKSVGAAVKSLPQGSSNGLCGLSQLDALMQD